MNPFFINLSIAVLGGILPALVWLLFWLREDREHPEPIRLLFFTFVVGMFVVVPALKLESIVYDSVSGVLNRMVLWSIIEEVGKFLVAYIVILRRKEVDEPIDYVVYMVTLALGFAAAENTLFLYSPLTQGLAVMSLKIAGWRFIETTLVHIVSSAAVGVALALAFYRNRSVRFRYGVAGLILASVLHSAFNVSIIGGGATVSLVVPTLVWISVIVVLLFMEKVKRIRPTNH